MGSAAPGFQQQPQAIDGSSLSGTFHDTVNAGNIQTGPITGQVVTVGHGNTVTVNIYQGQAYPRPNYRLESAYLVQFYQQAFVGRETECQQIAALTAVSIRAWGARASGWLALSWAICSSQSPRLKERA